MHSSVKPSRQPSSRPTTSQPSPKWHYFMHATHLKENIFNILKSGEIRSCGYTNSEDFNPDDKEAYCKKAVYCHYIFDELPRLTTTFQWNYYDYIIVLRPEIARDFEMTICNSVSHGQCTTQTENRILHTEGNLKRMPSLQKIRDYIIGKIDSIKHNKRLISDSYIYGHEVLFPSIPIEYIAAILIPARIKNTIKVRMPNGKKEEKQIYDVLNNYVEQLNLPIKIIKYSKSGDFHKYFEQI